MRVGSRWSLGGVAPAGLPAALLAAVPEWEALAEADASWTLTWLEGRPRCALAGVGTLTVDASGALRREPDAGGPAAPGGPGSPDGFGEPDDDDDDWLS